MKSASEIRASMDQDNSNAPEVMSRLESEIARAAKLGYGHAVVFVLVEDCSIVCANNIRSKLLDLGYRCKIEYVGVVAGDDCIKFFIQW